MHATRLKQMCEKRRASACICDGVRCAVLSCRKVIQNEMKLASIFRNNALVLKTLGSNSALVLEVLKCIVPRLQSKRQSSLLANGLPPVQTLMDDTLAWQLGKA